MINPAAAAPSLIAKFVQWNPRCEIICVSHVNLKANWIAGSLHPD
jgi:hypothetical protein